MNQKRNQIQSKYQKKKNKGRTNHGLTVLLRTIQTEDPEWIVMVNKQQEAEHTETPYRRLRW